MSTPTTFFTGCSSFLRHLQGGFILTVVLSLPTIVQSQETRLFGAPRVLFEHTARVMKATLTSDRLTLYFCDLPVDDVGATAIWEARHPTRDAPFGTAVRLGPVVNRGFFPWSPFLSSDDRFLYFSVGHVPEAGQLYVAPRSPEGRIDEAFPLDVGRTAYMGCVSPDSSELFFVSGPLQDRHPWVARFNVPGQPERGFHSIGKLGHPNLPADEWPPGITPDGRVLLWSHRPWSGSPPVPPGHGGADLWMAYHPSPRAPFGPPVGLPSPPNASGAQAFPFVPEDGRTLLYSTVNRRRILEVDACFAADIAVTFSVPEELVADQEILFDATESSTEEGAIESYEWWLGDGEVADGVQVSHRYAAGRYPVTLIVKSDQGACNHTRQMITVTCPSAEIPDWTPADVGNPALPGNASLAVEDDRCFAVCAGGSGLSSTSDQFHFVHQETEGEAVLTAQISELAAERQPATVGVMLRESLDPGARYAAVFVEGSTTKRFRFRYRQEAGEGSRRETAGVAELPDAWIQIRRVGRQLIGSSSPDGGGWTEIGRAEVDFPGVFLAGVAACGSDRFPEQPYIALSSTVCNVSLTAPRFVRGDANTDGTVDLSDAINTLGFLFIGDSEITCPDAADSNDDGTIDISDAINTNILWEPRNPSRHHLDRLRTPPCPDEATPPVQGTA